MIDHSTIYAFDSEAMGIILKGIAVFGVDRERNK